MPDVSGAIKTFIRTYADMKPDEERAALLDLREQVSDLEEENRALKRENDELKAELARKKALETYRGASYVLESDGTKTGPVCPACYNEGIVVLLERGKGGARCARCNTRYPGVESEIEGCRQRIG